MAAVLKISTAAAAMATTTLIPVSGMYGHVMKRTNRTSTHRADDQQHRSAHVGTVQRFDALLHVGHRFPLPLDGPVPCRTPVAPFQESEIFFINSVRIPGLSSRIYLSLTADFKRRILPQNEINCLRVLRGFGVCDQYSRLRFRHLHLAAGCGKTFASGGRADDGILEIFDPGGSPSRARLEARRLERHGDRLELRRRRRRRVHRHPHQGRADGRFGPEEGPHHRAARLASDRPCDDARRRKDLSRQVGLCLHAERAGQIHRRLHPLPHRPELLDGRARLRHRP